MLTTENYEVIKFIEHGGKCHIIMDCASGRLLCERLKDTTGITQEKIYKWFQMLASELERYRRCKNGQCYRYINPFSVLVTHQDKIRLLDLSAQSNAFVLKNMEKYPMREYFVKPVIHILDNTGLAADLYGFGKTIQFILAYTEGSISHSKRQEHLLSGIIEKCLGKSPKKKYENLTQLQKELQRITPAKQKKRQNKQQKKTILTVLTIVLILFGICTLKSTAREKGTTECEIERIVYLPKE